MIETEFLKLKYHANVESNTDEVDAEEYFNNNYKKIDANAKKQNEDLTKIKEDLEQENTELASNMPWNTVQGKSLHITDSAKYSKNKLSISGDMEQEKRSGKNKFKIPPSATGYNVTLTKNEDGTFNLSGTATGNASFLAFVDLDKSGIKNGASYIFHFTKNLQAGVEFRAEMYNGANWLRAIAPNINSTTSTSTGTANTTNATRVRFGIFVTSGTTVNIQNLGVQLEEGTTATEYEKYGAMPSTEFPSMPVVCTGVQKIKQFGKNFIPLSTNRTLNGVTLSVNEKGVYTLNGTATNNCFFTIPLKKVLSAGSSKTMSLQILDGTASGNGAFYLAFRVRNSSNIYSNVPDIAELQYKSNTNKYTTKTIINECATAEITVLNGVILNNVKLTIQLEEGTIATEYEPYWEKIHTLDLGTTQLCAIKDADGNVVAKDRHVYRNDKWQWEKIIKKFVLKGTENWFKSGNPANISYGISNAINDVDTSTITLETDRNFVAKAVCNYFLTVGLNTLFSDTEGFTLDILSNGTIELRLGFGLNTQITTVALLKEWLAQKYQSGNPVIVYYILKTPIYEDCTAEQSEVLDKLYNNFTLQKGINNIIVESSNGVGVNLELDYMQDNILKDKKLEDRVTALEDLLSTTQTSALLLDNLQNDLESEVN